ncbi:uncharacterized protein LOC144563911 [Carex rostrata]
MATPAFAFPRVIQFANDTVIVTKAHPETLKVIALVLTLYEDLSGLRINKSRNTFIPVATPPRLVPVIQNILACDSSNLPITYLGLPLTLRKPRKFHYQPILEAVQARLQRWKTNIISYGGRVTLVKSVVLSAMPLHYMQTNDSGNPYD